MATLTGQIAEATVTQCSRTESLVSDAAGGPRLVSARANVRYAGGIEGESVLAELCVCFDDGSATLYAIERIEGKVGGRAGSFVLEHVGTSRNGVVTSKRTVVPASGTGELAGLRGVIDAVCGRAPHSAITFHYCFD